MLVKIIAKKDGYTHMKVINKVTHVKPLFKSDDLVGLEVDGVKYISEYFETFEISKDIEDNV